MLVTNQLVEVSMSGKTISHYRELGYEVQDIKTKIVVPVEHLTNGSHVEVNVICDRCHKPFKREYKRYLKCTDNGLDYCEECGKGFRAKETVKQRYNVDAVMNIPGIKEKQKQTLLAKYGVEHYSKTQEWKEKTTNTCLQRYGTETFLSSSEARNRINRTVKDKYGVDYVGQLKWLHEKAKQTSLIKYGTEYPIQYNEIREKIKNTWLEKYGVENPLFSEEVLQKVKNTNLEKYGVENPFASKVIIEKIQNTNIEKYGVPYVMQSEEIRNKAKDSMIEHYGYPYVLQVPELRNKAFQTMSKNGTVPTSSQQIKIFNIIKEKYPDAKMNYPFNLFSLDIFLCVDNIKIDIEYDGWYWHQDQQKDIKRDMVLKANEYKICRIRSKRNLPSKEQILDAIDELITTNKNFIRITTDDWYQNEQKEGESA